MKYDQTNPFASPSPVTKNPAIAQDVNRRLNLGVRLNAEKLYKMLGGRGGEESSDNSNSNNSNPRGLPTCQRASSSIPATSSPPQSHGGPTASGSSNRCGGGGGGSRPPISGGGQGAKASSSATTNVDLPFPPLTRRWTFSGAKKESDILAAFVEPIKKQSSTNPYNGSSPPSSNMSTPPPPTPPATSGTTTTTKEQASAATVVIIEKTQSMTIPPSTSTTSLPEEPPSFSTTPSTPITSSMMSASTSSSSIETKASITSTVSKGSSSSSSSSGLKRQLHKASVAQELLEAVAELVMEQNPACLNLKGDEGDMQEQAKKLVKDHFARLPNRYALNVDAPEVLIDMRLMEQARGTDKVTVDVQPSAWDSPEEARSTITLSCVDRPNLLDSITRIISRLSSTIVDADIMTSRDGLTLDRFIVEHKELAEQVASAGCRQKLDLNALRKVLDTALNGGEDCIQNLSPSRLIRSTSSNSTSSLSSAGKINSSPTLDKDGEMHAARHTNSGSKNKSNNRSSIGGGSEDKSGEEIPFSELQLIEVVGSGHSGSLWRAKWKDMLVAVKMIKAPDDEEKRERFLNDFERERSIVRGLRHPNLCRLYGVSESPGNYCLVYDFLEGGSLASLLRDRSKPYDMFAIAIDVGEGMDYLHKRGVMHRDLKSDNLLLNKESRAVIADFGLVCPTITVSDHTGETGTYRWMAPEVIRHEPYSTAADVYSYGIVLWELLTRDQPFRGMTPIQAAFAVARKGYRPNLPPRTPGGLAELINACWQEDPLRRPTFSQIVNALKRVRAELFGAVAK